MTSHALLTTEPLNYLPFWTSHALLTTKSFELSPFFWPIMLKLSLFFDQSCFTNYRTFELSPFFLTSHALLTTNPLNYLPLLTSHAYYWPFIMFICRCFFTWICLNTKLYDILTHIVKHRFFELLFSKYMVYLCCSRWLYPDYLIL